MRAWSVVLVVVLAAASGCSGSRQVAGAGDAGMDVTLPVPVDAGEETGMSPAADGSAEVPPAVDGSADGAVVPASVRIIRGDPAMPTWLTLTIEGQGLTALEGRLVSARIGMPDRPPERLGSGQARVEDGAFTITFPDVWEYSLYKRKLVFVDVDDDGVCTGADQTFSDSRAAADDTVLTLPGSVPPGPTSQTLRSDTDVAAACLLWAMPWPDI